jgi:PPM family protein phosphatase
MIMSVDARSDMGVVRTNNEDMVLVKDRFLRDEAIDVEMTTGGDPFIIAVSDGMGGHNGGELASEFVLRNFAERISGLPLNLNGEDLHQHLFKIIHEIHSSLNQLGETNAALQGLGCTFTGLLFYGDKLYTIHVGDSRLYRMRGPFLTRLTKDHSLRELLQDESIPSNQLSNCFGGGAADIFFDFSDDTERVTSGDLLLICSDGLSGEISDDTISDILATDGNTLSLVEAGKAAAGRDNISCVLLKIKEPAI